MDISTHVTKKKRETSLMKKFESLSSKLPIKDKQALRSLELQMLRPTPIKRYRGPTTGRQEFAKRCIRLTFPDKDWIMRWMKLFRVNSYLEYNSWDINFLMEILSKLESGRLVWNKKKKCYYLISAEGRRIKI